MASKVAEICESKLKPIINELGYELIEVEYAKKVDGYNLTFIIDSQSGILIEDCEKVHRTIDPILDELNPTGEQPYILNVSSPGLDRPIKTQWDFNKHHNKEVEVKLYVPIDKKKSYIGLLKKFDDNSIVIEIENKEFKFDKKQVAIVLPVIKF